MSNKDWVLRSKGERFWSSPEKGQLVLREAAKSGSMVVVSLWALTLNMEHLACPIVWDPSRNIKSRVVNFLFLEMNQLRIKKEKEKWKTWKGDQFFGVEAFVRKGRDEIRKVEEGRRKVIVCVVEAGCGWVPPPKSNYPRRPSKLQKPNQSIILCKCMHAYLSYLFINTYYNLSIKNIGIQISFYTPNHIICLIHPSILID